MVPAEEVGPTSQVPERPFELHLARCSKWGPTVQTAMMTSRSVPEGVYAERQERQDRRRQGRGGGGGGWGGGYYSDFSDQPQVPQFGVQSGFPKRRLA